MLIIQIAAAIYIIDYLGTIVISVIEALRRNRN
jgi:hypothetical protein